MLISPLLVYFSLSVLSKFWNPFEFAASALCGSPRPAVLQPCFSRASAALQPCFSRASAMLQPCFSRASAVLQLCFSCASAVLQPCFSRVPAVFSPVNLHTWNTHYRREGLSYLKDDHRPPLRHSTNCSIFISVTLFLSRNIIEFLFHFV